MSQTVPIVIPAFRRTGSLTRLVTSLLRADIPDNVRLIIAIDRAANSRYTADNQAVVELARAVHWPHGPLDIIWHEQPLGLMGNTYFCHSLAAEYGAVIVLEDDLVVGRPFYTYAMQALAAYGNDPRIAGISLNTLWYNGFTHQPFIPLPDSADVFFLQLGTPQGQLYTADQWQAYSNWVSAADRKPADERVHPLVAQMPKTDWLPNTIRYLAATDRYYVFPRESLTVSFGDAGTHISQNTDFFQVPVQDFQRGYRLGSLDESAAVYDTFYEPQPTVLAQLCPVLAGIDFAVDLYATKQPEQLMSDLVLTTRPADKSLMGFARTMRPMEANVIHNIGGDEIVLAKVSDVDFSASATAIAQAANDAYFNRHQTAGCRSPWFNRFARWRSGRRTR
ncbi:MAG: hypothetical protein R3C44_16545 [Chloroflexota bacterium]